MRAWIGSCIVALVAAAALSQPAMASGNTVKFSWYAQAIIKLTLTPNYASGYGPIKAVFGTQPTPAPPAGTTCPNGCAVDFGPVLAGTDYLYKYAVHLNVASNDNNGFRVYGEGAADFFNQNDSTSQPLNTTVYYLSSTTGGLNSDPNTGFSPSFPFSKTSNPVTPPSFGTAPTITYSTGTYPSPIAQVAAATGDLYYDYQLKVPPAATNGAYYVWIVYTVVAQ